MDELDLALANATPVNPSFIVYFDMAAIRVATPEEIAAYRAQNKHLCLCKPMKLAHVWMKAYRGKGIASLG